MVVAYERRAGRAGRADSVATFAAGYFAAWLAAGLLAYAVIEGVRSLGPGFLAWDEAGRYVAAAVIAGAGLYQLTELKGACLRACGERAARSWPSAGAPDGSARCGWGSSTAAGASAAAGR